MDRKTPNRDRDTTTGPPREVVRSPETSGHHSASAFIRERIMRTTEFLQFAYTELYGRDAGEVAELAEAGFELRVTTQCDDAG
jgi:hypothetical protein